MQSKFIIISIITLLWCTKLLAQPTDKFFKALDGQVYPELGWYTGTQSDSVKIFSDNALKVNGYEWNCSVTFRQMEEAGALDLLAAFRLVNRKATQVAPAVIFEFSHWSSNNYSLVPASAYNGNRYRSIGNGYMPQYPKHMYYNPDVPLTISNNPRLALNPSQPSLIELQTTNAATPAVCFYSPSLKKGFILLTEQTTLLENSGITIQENADRTKLPIKITAPDLAWLLQNS